MPPQVEGVADEAVHAALDELVIFLQGDVAAELLAQRPQRHQPHRGAGYVEHQAGIAQGIGLGEDQHSPAVAIGQEPNHKQHEWHEYGQQPALPAYRPLPFAKKLQVRQAHQGDHATQHTHRNQPGPRRLGEKAAQIIQASTEEERSPEDGKLRQQSNRDLFPPIHASGPRVHCEVNYS